MIPANKILSHLFPSVGNIIFLVFFLFLLMVRGQGLLDDGDTGYHIRAGEYIIENLSIPKHDIYSYHTPPIPWIAHEWLSEAIMGWFHIYFGLNGVIFLFSLLIAFIFYFLFKFIRLNDGNIIISTLLVIFAAVTSSMHWLARPHIMSLLLMLSWYFILDQFQYRNRKWLFILPLIMLLWVNLHGGFITGILLTGVYFIGNFIQTSFSDGEKRKICKGKARILFLILSLCVISALLNPNGYKILLFPFSIISEKIFMDNVSEFLSPNFHDLSYIIFEIFLLMSIFIFMVSIKRCTLIEIMLVILFIHMSLYSRRYIPLFSIILSPIIIKHIGFLLQERKGRLFNRFNEKAKSYAELDRISKGYLWPGIGIVIAVLWMHSGSVNYGINEKIKPVKAVEFLKREIIKGNMFNNDEFGDYLIYSAFPEYKVFIDGRLDMYGPEKIREYRKISEFKSGWQEIIDKYEIHWIFYDSDSPLSRFLLEKSDWKLIYSDKVANIFVKNIDEYGYLIRKYMDVVPVIKEEKGEEN